MPLNVSVIQELIEAGVQLDRIGCLPATDGNFSARCGDGKAIVTRASTRKSRLEENDFVSTEITDLAPVGASSEWKLHRTVYLERPDVGCVLHAHAPFLTAFAVTHNIPNVLLTAESALLIGEIALVTFAKPGTEDVGKLLIDQSRTASVYLLANHGVVAVGASVNSALHRLERAEFLAQVEIHSLTLGAAIPLSPRHVFELGES